jgi:hypothetical protein
MGTWSVSIFASDIALDIRNDFRHMLATGLNADEAREKIKTEWQSSFEDPDESVSAWLAFALTLWDYGMLDEDTKLQAEFAGKAGDLILWPEKLRASRKCVIREAIDKLSTQNPNPARVKLKKLATCAWSVGSILRYRSESERIHYLYVLDHQIDQGGTYPMICVLSVAGDGCLLADSKWVGEIAVKELNIAGPVNHLLMVRFTAKSAKKIELVGVRAGLTEPAFRGAIIQRWAGLDAVLDCA